MVKKFHAAVFALLLIALVSMTIALFYDVPRYVHEVMVKDTGSYAPLYLYDYSPYGRIIVEVHYGGNATPSMAALEHLRAVLHDSTGKPVDLYAFEDIDPQAVPQRLDDRNVSSFGDALISGHQRNRTGWMWGIATMYVLYVDSVGPEPRVRKDGVVAGVSFRADGVLIFDRHVRDDDVERSVLVHEAGHLLGLEHDDDPGCAMVAALVRNRSKAVGEIVPPADFCEAHQRQLEIGRRCLINASVVSIPALL